MHTPYTVAPTVLNRDEVTRAREREYAEDLRESGVVGTARVFILIDDGTVFTRRPSGVVSFEAVAHMGEHGRLRLPGRRISTEGVPGRVI